MEYASLLAGVGFTDHPRCTHPLLAHVARMVNDALDDENRQRIAPLVPAVIGVRTPSPELTATLVMRLTISALQHEPDGQRLARLRRRAERRSNALGLRRRVVILSEPMYRTSTATQAVAQSLRTIAAAGPDALRQAFEDAVVSARQIAQLPTASVELPERSASEAAVRTR